MSKIIKCKVCGQEKEKKQKICPNCGQKTPVYKKKSFYFLILIAIFLVFYAINNIKVDAVVITQNGTTYNCNGYEYKKYFNEYPNDKENPFLKASISVTDKIKSISVFEVDGVVDGGYIILKSGWGFYVDEINSDLKKGATIILEGEVGYQNITYSSWTLVTPDDYTIIKK